jgi:hypothetical protein
MWRRVQSVSDGQVFGDGPRTAVVPHRQGRKGGGLTSSLARDIVSFTRSADGARSHSQAPLRRNPVGSDGAACQAVAVRSPLLQPTRSPLSGLRPAKLIPLGSILPARVVIAVGSKVLETSGTVHWRNPRAALQVVSVAIEQRRWLVGQPGAAEPESGLKPSHFFADLGTRELSSRPHFATGRAAEETRWNR